MIVNIYHHFTGEVVKVIVENVSNWKTQSLYLGNILNAACFFEQVSIVKYILEKDEDNTCLNAKINTSDFTNYHDSIGNALHKVCELSREEGANEKETEITRLLLEKNSELIRVTDNLDNTPLHMAFECRDLDMIKLLLEYASKEDLSIKNGNGQTILYLAQRLDDTDIKGQLQVLQNPCTNFMNP